MSPRLAKKSIRGTASDAKSSKTPSTGRARGRGRGRGRTSKNEREATPENIAESPGSRYSPSPSYLASDSDDERPSTINIEDEKYTKFVHKPVVTHLSRLILSFLGIWKRPTSLQSKEKILTWISYSTAYSSCLIWN